MAERVKMVAQLNFYIDDSGSRHPDKDTAAHSATWFGLGGVIVREEDEAEARALYDAFRERWEEHLRGAPLHSHEIRNKNGPFAWLGKDRELCSRFLADVSDLISKAPIICTACVIDRAGYRNRYGLMYSPEQRWSLCKTAFAVVVERAVKWASVSDQRVRIFVERSDKTTDAWMKNYYTDLRVNGMPFNPKSMASYAPAEASLFHRTLYDFKTKNKSSPMMQLADLCLYPICRSGYDETGRAYGLLVEQRKLINTLLKDVDVPLMGVKYSCFEQVERKKSVASGGTNRVESSC